MNACDQPQQAMISIIIPVFNEATTLPLTLPPLVAMPNLEVIVVDGGSGDRTVALAQSYGATVFTAPQPGRAPQMNYGASQASGDIFLFLHADTQLPPDFPHWVEMTLAKPGVIVGAFQLQIADDRPALRWVERLVQWRSHYLALPYGDQGLFIAKSDFEQWGGFPDLPIMEDFVWVRQMGKQGKIAIAPAAVHTSARRWQRLGLLKTTGINQLMILGYTCGINPHRLARWYRSWR